MASLIRQPYETEAFHEWQRAAAEQRKTERIVSKAREVLTWEPLRGAYVALCVIAEEVRREYGA